MEVEVTVLTRRGAAVMRRSQRASGPRIRLGRGTDNEVPLADIRVGLHIAQLVTREGGIAIEKLGSSPLIINGESVEFARLNPGDQYPQAHQHALAMLAERIKMLQAQGKMIREGSGEYEQLRSSIVPPYDAGKFPNKWRKMWRDEPARTLMAHLGKDSYSHIHYDSEQARTISVREAARLQSFPDGFAFCGTMNPAFRQIGNAVPPLMAKVLAAKIAVALGIKQEEEPHEPARAAAAV